MKTINIAICEDSKLDAERLHNYLKKAEKEEVLKLNIDFFTTGTAFINQFSPIYDIIFLDMVLPDMEGAQVASIIRRIDETVYLIFISQYSDYILCGYQYEVKNYLMKPIHYTDIRNEIRKFLQVPSSILQAFFMLSNQQQSLKLYYRKLRYLETDKGQKHVLLHYDGKVLRHPERLADFFMKLPEQLFYQCNRSYMVNLLYIKKIVPDISRYQIQLITGETLPLSRDKKRELLLYLQKAGELC